jgi:hypothetical protein
MSSEAERLRVILSGMNLPKQRVENLDKGWLLRNIGIYNAGHPDFEEAVALLQRL